jgi:alanyl aminopeptidase
VAYRGVISAKDDRGVFVEEEGGASYVFSQFESIDARKAFPCFDEPTFKTPWQLSLRVRREDVALSNTPVTAEEPAEGGMKLVRFAETKPLPSYLIAFAVGPFELVDAGKAGRNQTPVRIAVPRGRSAQARYAASTTTALMGVLEDEVGRPYPYEKLDVVPIPRLVSFGAMENPGLITFYMTGTLATPAEETVAFKRDFAQTMAHELAHQWFGNLVTTAFWDDIWLNEAFATWMGSKTVARWQPGWDEPIDAAGGVAWAMQQDGLISTRKIRQEVTTKDDIQNAFDGITYQKGSAVLGMFEAWAGAEKFQRGVRRYLERHAHATATAPDFLAAMGAEVGQEIVPAMKSFLDQPGVPLVRGDLACGQGQPPRLRLTQERFLPVGSPGAPPQRWQIPVCVRYEAGKAEGRACTLLTEASAEIALGSEARCPEWVLLNEGGAGYYRAAYGADAIKVLLGRAPRISTLERLAVIRDVVAFAEGGRLPAADALALVPGLAKDPSPHVLRSAVRLAGGVRDSLIAEDLRPNYARFVRAMFGAKARAVGLTPRPGEDEQTRLLRPALLQLVANRGEDTALLAEARRITDRWLADAGSIDSDSADLAVSIAARRGDRALFDRLLAEARKAKEQKRRNVLLDGLASFRDPALRREALALIVSQDFDIRDTVWMMFPREERSTDVSVAFVKERFDALVARMPGELHGVLPRVGGNLCGEASRADLAAFFTKERVGRLTGGPRALAQTLEGISLCGAQREAQSASVAAFLKRY